MPTNRFKTLIMLHVAVLLAGWTGVFGRLISLDGLPLVWYRVMISVPCMIVILAVTGRFKEVPFAHILPILGCGVLLAIHWVAFYKSIQASNVSIGVACIATTGFFTALFSPRLKKLLLSFISIAGILLIFSLDVQYRTGIIWGLSSAFVYAVFANCNIKVGEKTGLDSATMLLWELTGCLLFLSAVVPIVCKSFPMPQGNDPLWLLILGSILTIIPFLFQIIALRRLSAFTVNITYNLEPVYSILFASLLFGEAKEVGWTFWCGIGLVILSVLAVSLLNYSK